jgi:hypothetical protein
LIISSERSGTRNIFWQDADGRGTAERLSEGPNLQDAVSLSPAGTRLLVNETSPTTGIDLMQLELGDGSAPVGGARGQSVGPRHATPLIQTPFTERNGEVSPNGRWIAYEASDSGQLEIYVRPYPDVGRGLWQVSTGGDTRPLWARTGQELLYLSPAGARSCA